MKILIIKTLLILLTKKAISQTFESTFPSLSNITNKNYNFTYKIKDFITLKNPYKSSKSSMHKIGILDSGISKKFSKKHPEINLQNFTDDENPYDTNGHGTFSLSVK